MGKQEGNGWKRQVVVKSPVQPLSSLVQPCFIFLLFLSTVIVIILFVFPVSSFQTDRRNNLSLYTSYHRLTSPNHPHGPSLTTIPPITVPVPSPTTIPPTIVPAPSPTTIPPITVPAPSPTTIPPITVPAPSLTTIPPITVPVPSPTTIPPTIVPAPSPTTIPPITVPAPSPTTIPPITVPAPSLTTIPPTTVPAPPPTTIPPTTVPAPPPTTIPPITVPAPSLTTIPPTTVPAPPPTTIPPTTVPAPSLTTIPPTTVPAPPPTTIPPTTVPAPPPTTIPPTTVPAPPPITIRPPPTNHYHFVYPRTYHFIMDEPDKCKTQTLFLVLMVPVAPSNLAARDAIRRTWGNETLVQGKKVQTLFMLGLPGGPAAQELQDKVNQESQVHHDLLQSNFLDSYLNLTIKTMVIMDWLATHCTNATYAMKIDSDMFLNVENLMTMLLRPDVPKVNYLTGMLMWNRPVIRDPHSKWYVPVEMLADNLYPTYTLGMGYVFSNDLPERFVGISKDIKPFNIEDAYIGACMKKLGLSPRNPPDPWQWKAYLGKYNRCEFSKVITYILGRSSQIMDYWTDLKKTPGPPCP